MIVDLIWTTFVLRHYFFTQENKNIFFTPVNLQCCQGMSGCKIRIVILKSEKSELWLMPNLVEFKLKS
jgi:DnaJ-class molecular chaperone